MHLHIFHMEMQISHFRDQVRARSGIPKSTKEKIGARTCLEGSGQTLSVTIMCKREISASFYQQMVGEDSRLPSIYFPQQLLIPDVEKVFFLNGHRGERIPTWMHWYKSRAKARTSMVTRIVADHILQTASPRHNGLKTRRGEKHQESSFDNNVPLSVITNSFIHMDHILKQMQFNLQLWTIKRPKSNLFMVLNQTTTLIHWASVVSQR